MAKDAVRVFEGSEARAEVLVTMLQARGIAAAVTPGHEIEGGTAVFEAAVYVPSDQADEARALIADID